MMVQGKFQQALQFADSICQQAECKLGCSLARFEASLLLGEFEKAEQYFDRYQEAGPSGVIFNKSRINRQIGYVYDQLGKTEEAEIFFSENIQRLQSRLGQERLNRSRSDDYLRLARIYAFQGTRKEAEYAKWGFSGGQHDFILIDPFFQSLWDDPEFKAIVKKAQEEKAALRAKVREMEERGELDL
jgi:tetratricopeptide (TPR) repeat protein